MKSKIVILILVLSILGTPDKNWMAQAQETTGSISFTPSAIPEIGFEYNPAEYQFELTWKTYYLNIKPFAIYNDQYYEMKQIIPWLKNNYPNIDYRTAVNKFKNYHRWGFWLEKLPQNVADNLDYLGFELDYNIPLSAIEVEKIEAVNFTFKRIHIGGRFTLDFYDLYERGFEVKINKTTILIGNVKGKTDLDLDPITYAAPVMTVVGTNGGSPWTYWDLWNASNANGWNVVNNTGNHQFQFWAKLQIGDGAITTYFTDYGKQVFFDGSVIQSNWDKVIIIKRYANMTLGDLVYDANKITKDGCTIYMARYDPSVYFFYVEGILDLFNSVIGNYNYSVYALRITITATGAFRAYNSLLDRVAIMNDHGNSTIYNLVISGWGPGGEGFILFGGNYEIDKLTVVNWNRNLYLRGEAILNNVYSRNPRLETFRVHTLTGNVYLRNTDIDPWTFTWGGVSTAEVYRQNTFNVVVVDSRGNPVEYAEIVLSHSGQGGGINYTGISPANGSIPEQIISKGFYNQTGGDTIYPYEPYNLTVTKSGYESMILIFNVNDPIDWTIALVEESIDVVINNDLVLFIFFLLSLITFIGMIISQSIVISVTSAALSFISWGVTAIVYLYNYYEYPGPALLFGLFGVIALLYTIYAGMKLMNPYEKEKLNE